MNKGSKGFVLGVAIGVAISYAYFNSQAQRAQ